MKLIFSFTDTPDIKSLQAKDIYNSSIEIPDEAKYLIGYEERILEVAKLVGDLTCACLHFSCKDIGIKDSPIKNESVIESQWRLGSNISTCVFLFSRTFAPKKSKKSQELKIYSPLNAPLPDHLKRSYGKNKRERNSLRHNVRKIVNIEAENEIDRKYLNAAKMLPEHLVMLLNAEPAPSELHMWAYWGFHPHWVDNRLIDRLNNRRKKDGAEARKQEREEEKRQKLIAAGKNVDAKPHPLTGAGRRPGAVPGIFMGIQFRSQLEIRLASELQERGIQWIYEPERIGGGNYLVDFYLPELKAWVEVKGKFEARDNFLLKDTAEILQERGEKLFVYTSGKPIIVLNGEFQKLTSAEFWEMLESS